MTAFRRLTAGLAVLALALGGCGLPDRTDPKYVGPAAEPSRAQDRAQEPSKPDGATSLTDLVTRYLATSVGGNIANADQPDAVSETQIRMKTFMTKEAAAAWRLQAPSLLVVRSRWGSPVREGTTGRPTIALSFTRVGQLDRDGRLVSPPNDAGWTPGFDFTFAGEEVNGQLLLSKAPPYMLLSEEAFNTTYVRQPIYFWEKDVESPKLVPDLRYMPNVLPASKRVSEVMQWLVDGPSSWLTSVVDKLSSDIATKDTPTLVDKTWNVNLGSKAAGKSPEEQRKLASQIRWSLDQHPPVSLSYENAKDTTNDSGGFRSDNAAMVGGEVDQEKFVVVNETVRQLLVTTDGPALFADSEWNKSVQSATINRERTRAALVRKVGTKYQLFVNSDTREPKYVDSTIPPAAMLSRPAWINRPMPRFLVTDGSKLWAVTPPGTAGERPVATAVLGPNGQELTNVSAFSVAPDGRRIALIVKNATVLAPLRIENGNLTLGEQHPVPNSLADNQAVGWIAETTLAIGGQPNSKNESLVRTSIDGTGELSLPKTNSAVTVTELSARTSDPSSTQERVLVLFQSGQQGRVVFNEDTLPIETLIPAGPSPAPSGSPQVQKVPYLSPFYAD